jgi:hypothetical protein
MEHCSNKNDNVSPSTVHQKYYAGQEIMTQGHYEYSSNTTYYKQKTYRYSNTLKDQLCYCLLPPGKDLHSFGKTLLLLL